MFKTILNPDPTKSEKLYLDPKLTVMPHIGSSTSVMLMWPGTSHFPHSTQLHDDSYSSGIFLPLSIPPFSFLYPFPYNSYLSFLSFCSCILLLLILAPLPLQVRPGVSGEKGDLFSNTHPRFLSGKFYSSFWQLFLKLLSLLIRSDSLLAASSLTERRLTSSWFCRSRSCSLCPVNPHQSWND